MIDWHALFVPTENLGEIFIRGTLTYLMLFVAMRIGPKRNAGGLGISEVLLVVVVAHAAHNGLSGDYHSLTESALLVVTVIFWYYAITWLSLRVRALQYLAVAPHVQIIRQGRIDRRALRAEYVSMDELESELRKQGIENVAEVKSGFIEGGGEFSFVRNDPAGAPPPRAGKVA